MIENRLAPTLSLNGAWQIKIGDHIRSIQVPGVWETQGLPLDMDEACYRRSFEVPAEWADARIYLRFGAVSYFAQVSVNEQPVGSHEGLWTPFEFDITSAIRAGETNQLEVHVVKPGNSEDSDYFYRKVLVGFIPYVSTTFGGIWQDVELVAHRAVAWKAIHIKPDWRTGNVILKTTVDGFTYGLTAQVEIHTADGLSICCEERAVHAPGEHVFQLTVDNPQRWSPGTPFLYGASLRLKHADNIIAEATRRFGFRELHTDGDHLLLNGEAVSLRGILSWGWNPDTLAPASTESQIRDEFRRVRDLGFNLVKLCLYVPTQNVFDIADEEGMLLWLELPMWWQIMNDHLRRQAPVEYVDILAGMHHHPSIVIYSLGCELSADMADDELLGRLNDVVRASASNVLICDNSGSGEAYDGLTYDLADFNDYHFYTELHDFVPLLDHFRRDGRVQRPWIFGEFCYSDDYRDPTRLVDADGKRAWWRDLLGVGSSIERWAYRDQETRMAALGLSRTDEELVRLSRQKSFVIRKHTLETVRSRRGMGGYVVTGLRDTPISTSGVFDDHNQSKFDPRLFRQFNTDGVLILEGGRSRRWVNADQPYPRDRFNHWSGDTMNFHIALNYVGARPSAKALHWQLKRPDNTPPDQGEVIIGTLPVPGIPGEIAHINLTLPKINRPEQCTLLISLGDGLKNQWPLWIYPRPAELPENTTCYDPSGVLADLRQLPRHDFSNTDTSILITSAYTPEVRTYVEAGGRAILIQNGPGTLPTAAKSFWSMSLVLLEDHPILAQIPHEGFADLQFYHLAADYGFDTTRIPVAIPEVRHITPVVRGLDMRLFTVFDYLLELEIGAGCLLASTLRFSGGRGDQVKSLEANIVGRYLLSELILYLERD